jgi:catechol 2,3-dioxygenase-like lactoylglutathione lyase family enzyme
MTSSSLSLGQIAINCRDVARATAFYRDVLQLPLLFEAAAWRFSVSATCDSC